MSTRQIRTAIFLLGTLLTVAACSMSLPEGSSGSIALRPFRDEEQGLQGVTPAPGWTDQAQLIQLSILGTREDAVAVVLEQTTLTELPPSAGTCRGTALDWDLYTAEIQIHDAGPQTFHVDLALAEGEMAAYLVALAVLPDAYEENPALHKTVFRHALYALEPLD
jgi:hypothetical protein